jgi:hypothetical protein
MDGSVDVPVVRLPPPPPLTAEEQRRAFEVMEQLAEIRAMWRKARGGKSFPNSWEEFPNLYEPDDEDYAGS